MSTSPWIVLPNSDAAAGWPSDTDLVWIRMREYTRKPVRAKAAYDDPDGFRFEILDNDNLSLPYRVWVPWYAVDAWHAQ